MPERYTDDETPPVRSLAITLAVCLVAAPVILFGIMAIVRAIG